MSVLLACDQVELYAPPGDADAHGWALPGTAVAWSGTGSLQLSPASSDPRAADAGGAGPHAPAAYDLGVLFLPADAQPAEGYGAVIRGRAYVLSRVRLVADPTGGGVLDCYAADVSGWDEATPL